MMAGDAREIFVHRFSDAGGCNNLRFFLPKRSPVFSHFWEALTFCYFLVKQKVEEVKNDNPLGISDFPCGYASTCQVFFLLIFQSTLNNVSTKSKLSTFYPLRPRGLAFATRLPKLDHCFIS